MPAYIDLTDHVFGSLTAKVRVGTSNDGQAKWLCLCDCGHKVIVKAGNLRSGHTRSCGCYMKQRISETQAIHRQSHRRLYNVWSSIKARCYNPNNQFFDYYGGRGIVMCDDWRENYQSFHDWAMISGYDVSAKKGECTIDRIDVNGNYEPSNCRWVSMMIQRHNRRDTTKKEGEF